MTEEEAMEGRGHPVSYAEAAREMRRHYNEVAECNATHFRARCGPTDQWEMIPLNSKAILEWLGY